MRRVALFATAVGCVSAAALLTAARPDKPVDPAADGKFGIKSEAKNPWTGLTPNISPDQFQFAVVADRTGGHRKGVFSKAVQQVNLLQPEFVMSVGDLIEGSANADTNRKQWDEFDGYAKQFKMPFFYCPGNHDFGTAAKNDVWKERLGRAFYHFTYKNCLFVVLNSNDAANAVPPPPAGQQAPKVTVGIGKVQQEFLTTVLKENDKVRWTFVFLHHPVWAGRDITATGWLEVEKLLAGRKYNAFCGHVHTFRKFLRNGTSYYQLATTGGSSAMRGLEYGEFDQIAWVTMKDDAPVIAHIGLAGVFKDDLTTIETPEDGGVARLAEGVAEVVGTVTLNGKPGLGLQVIFHSIDGKQPDPKDPAAGRGAGGGRVTAEGTFTAYQTRGGAGLLPGKYVVTIAPAAPLIDDGKMRDNPVPAKYRAIDKTPFRVEVKPDTRNRFDLKLED